MNPEIVKFLGQLPAAGILAFTVWLFLKHLAMEGAANRQHNAMLNATLIEFYKEMHKDHTAQAAAASRAIEQMVAVTEKNVSATARNTYTLETTAKTLESLARMVEMFGIKITVPQVSAQHQTQPAA